jgi:hypothetical protein
VREKRVEEGVEDERQEDADASQRKGKIFTQKNNLGSLCFVP